MKRVILLILIVVFSILMLSCIEVYLPEPTEATPATEPIRRSGKRSDARAASADRSADRDACTNAVTDACTD